MTRAARFDLAVLAALTLMAALGFLALFGGWWFLLATLGGLVVGYGAAIAGAIWRLTPLNTALVAVVAYFLLGTPFALPRSGIAGVVPTVDTLAALAVGAVFSWRDALTLQTPVDGPDRMLVLPYIAASIVALVAASLILRWLPRHPASVGRAAAVLTPPLLLFVLTLVVGTDRPVAGVARAVAFGLLALVWLGSRRSGTSAAHADTRADTRAASPSTEARAALARRRVAGIAIVALGAGALGGGVGALASPAAEAGRVVVRDAVTPPFEPIDHVSPLAGFREYTKALRDTLLFSMTGLEQGDRVRLAVLDRYTGKAWEIADPVSAPPASGDYVLVGGELPAAPLLTSSSSRAIEVRIDGYHDIWLPTVGNPTSIQLTSGSLPGRRNELRANAATGTGLVLGGLAAGDSYAFTTEVQDLPLEGQLDNAAVAAIALPPSAPAPAALIERMQTAIQGQSTPYLQLRAIEQALRSQGYLSHGTASDVAPSRAGHGLDRMQELFDLRYMVGDAEQYASAMALMARALGFPARVVMGFAPGAIPDGGGPVDVRGADVTAWVEVAFEGFGWVAFDPTPEQSDVPVNTASDPQSKPRAQVRQPPQSEARPDELVTAAERPNDDEDRAAPFELPWWAALALGVVGVPLVVLGVPVLAAWWLRRHRRTRRQRGAPDARAAGAWDEAVDGLAELGFAVPSGATRSRQAEAMHPGLATIARRADAAVFGDVEPSEAELERVWADADALVRQVGSALPRWRRELARVRVRMGEGSVFRASPKRAATRITLEAAAARNAALRAGAADGEFSPSTPRDESA